MRRWFAVLALGAVVAACSEQTTSPRPRTPAVAADFTNNLDNGNPRIWRGEYDWGIAWTDPSNGLRVAHRTFPVVGEGCGDFEAGPLVAAQEVAWVDAADFMASRFILNAKGDVWIIVRDLNAPGDCFGNRLVAEGWGTIHATDSDEIAYYPNDRHNDDAVGNSAEGALTTPDGRTVQYSGFFRYTFDPATGALRHVGYKVSVH